MWYTYLLAECEIDIRMENAHYSHSKPRQSKNDYFGKYEVGWSTSRKRLGYEVPFPTIHVFFPGFAVLLAWLHTFT